MKQNIRSLCNIRMKQTRKMIMFLVRKEMQKHMSITQLGAVEWGQKF